MIFEVMTEIGLPNFGIYAKNWGFLNICMTIYPSPQVVRVDTSNQLLPILFLKINSCLLRSSNSMKMFCSCTYTFNASSISIYVYT